MENVKTEFEYELTTQFDVMVKGQPEPAISITLKAPSSKNLNECSMLKQAFFRSLPKGEEVQSDTVDAKIDDMEGADIIILLSMSTEIELGEALTVAKKLFSSTGIGFVNGDTKLTHDLINMASIDDLEGMLGDYLVNFILAFSLNRMKQKQLEASQT